MDDISESKRAVDLLTSRYSIIDFGGEVRYLKNSNVEELLKGEVNSVAFHSRKDHLIYATCNNSIYMFDVKSNSSSMIISSSMCS